MAKIKLFNPEFAGLQYGPDADEAIVFGPRGGMPPHEALVDEDHPLLTALLEAHPEVQIVTAGGPTQVFLCPVHPDREFKTKNSLLSHMRAKGHEGLAAPVDDEDPDDTGK